MRTDLSDRINVRFREFVIKKIYRNSAFKIMKKGTRKKNNNNKIAEKVKVWQCERQKLSVDVEQDWLHTFLHQTKWALNFFWSHLNVHFQNILIKWIYFWYELKQKKFQDTIHAKREQKFIGTLLQKQRLQNSYYIAICA